jgi:16S rRNA C967 or C1407 C5-methylase (RsmB/RsmF family)
MRWKSLFDYLKSDPENFNPQAHLNETGIPLHIRLSCPEELYTLLVEAFGPEKTEQFCLASNTRAPVTIRVNLLKISREELFHRWKNIYSLSLCTQTVTGIVFHERVNFWVLDEFKQGLFEVQDEASQLIGRLVDAKPKQQVLDFCAGAGGKTLAFAPSMQNKGQIYLHDIRLFALQEARKRASRAGIQNVQFGLHAGLKEKMDWVLVDVPCSGTGTYRRNPDLKWKFSHTLLERLRQEQRAIFEEALTYLHPQGKIVYATCSVLPQENRQQALYFQEKFNLKLIHQFESFPTKDGMDGFFGAVFDFAHLKNI